MTPGAAGDAGEGGATPGRSPRVAVIVQGQPEGEMSPAGEDEEEVPQAVVKLGGAGEY